MLWFVSLDLPLDGRSTDTFHSMHWIDTDRQCEMPKELSFIYEQIRNSVNLRLLPDKDL